MSKYNANLNQDAGSIHTPARYDDTLDKWIMDVSGEELLSMKASLEDLVTKFSNTLTVDDTESRAELEAMKVKLEAIEIKLNEQTYEDGAALTKLTGSIVTQDSMEYNGNVLADAPDPSTVPVGAEFTAIEDEIIYKNTGTYWKEWLVL